MLDSDTVKLWGLPVALALLAIGARLAISPERITLPGVVRGLILGVFVGCVTNAWLLNSTMSHGERGALVGVCAVIAEDLVFAILLIGKRIRKNPDAILNLLRKK